MNFITIFECNFIFDHGLIFFYNIALFEKVPFLKKCPFPEKCPFSKKRPFLKECLFWKVPFFESAFLSIFSNTFHRKKYCFLSVPCLKRVHIASKFSVAAVDITAVCVCRCILNGAFLAQQTLLLIFEPFTNL